MKSAQRAAFMICVLMLGCGGSASAWSKRTPIRGADGQDNWWKIHCEGDKSACERQASDACPTGYDVKDREGLRYLLVKCKGPGAPREEVEW